ncbi:MAG: polysaccharide biosynthesis C-terminal domain-containing protein, partial [Hyphomonadaceae bacterium]
LPKYGLMGAAYANVVAYGLGMTMLAWIGRRYVALPIPLFETAKIALACALMAGVVLALPSFGALQDLALKGGIGALSYGAFIMVLNVAGARDFAKSLWTRLRPQTGVV